MSSSNVLREGLHGQHMLARNSENTATGREHAQVRGDRKQGSGEFRAR
ncbi:hypothetical protein [Streptomyces sp. NPDC057690]